MLRVVSDVEAETPVLWPPDAKSWLIGKDPDAGKDWGQEEKGMTEDEMAGWHHRLDGHGLGWTLEVGDGQGGLVCRGPWGCKESDTTEWLNWTELTLNKGFLGANAGDIRDVGSIPGSGRSPREENGNSLQYSCLEKPWTEESGRRQSIRSQRAGHDQSDLAHTHTLNQHSSAFQDLILAPSVFTVHSLNYWNMILVFEPPWYFHCLGIFFPGLSQVIYRTRGRWIPLSCEGRKSND